MIIKKIIIPSLFFTIFSVFFTMEPVFISERNTAEARAGFEIDTKSIRINGINYRRAKAESATLGSFGTKRDTAKPYFDKNHSWSAIKAAPFVIQADAPMVTIDSTNLKDFNLSAAADYSQTGLGNSSQTPTLTPKVNNSKMSKKVVKKLEKWNKKLEKVKKKLIKATRKGKKEKIDRLNVRKAKLEGKIAQYDGSGSSTGSGSTVGNAIKSIGNSGSVSGSGGSKTSVDASYSLLKVSFNDKMQVAGQINNSPSGVAYLRAMKRKNDIRMVTAVWILVKGVETQGKDTNMTLCGGGKYGKVSGNACGSSSKATSATFTFKPGSVMAYEISKLGMNKKRQKKWTAVYNITTDKYRR